MGVFLPKMKKQAIARAYLSLGKCFTTLYALVWSVHDELVHV